MIADTSSRASKVSLKFIAHTHTHTHTHTLTHTHALNHSLTHKHTHTHTHTHTHKHTQTNTAPPCPSLSLQRHQTRYGDTAAISGFQVSLKKSSQTPSLLALSLLPRHHNSTVGSGVRYCVVGINRCSLFVPPLIRIGRRGLSDNEIIAIKRGVIWNNHTHRRRTRH